MARAESPERIFRDAQEYTVRIRTQITHPFIEDSRGSSSGAGFVIDSTRRWVATNAHVVGQSPSEIQVAFAGGEFRPARKVYVDSFTDVAILEVDPGDLDLVAPRLDCRKPPVVGEAVAAYGHPMGMPFTGSRGIRPGHTDQMLNDYIQIDASIDHGNSGGPVIALSDGRIVGMATAGIDVAEGKRLNLATPMQDVCRIVEILRQGGSPEPPVMEFALLVDEDNRHTMQVATTHDVKRWPFASGDRILSVGLERTPVATYSELITALRGRQGAIPVTVARDGEEVTVSTLPARTPAVVERRGLLVDGALVAPITIEDDAIRPRSTGLIIHSVEPGSTAETLGFAEQDELVSVDSREMKDIDALHAYLAERKQDQPVRILLRRSSDQGRRWADFHVREIPGESYSLIGATDPRTAVAGETERR